MPSLNKEAIYYLMTIINIEFDPHSSSQNIIIYLVKCLT